MINRQFVRHSLAKLSSLLERDANPPSVLQRLADGMADRDARTAAWEAARASETVTVSLRPIVPLHDGMKTESWFGGQPCLPEDTAWPRIADEAAHFVAQIDCSTLPLLLWGGRGPRSGWFSVFIARNDDEDTYRACAVHTNTLGAARTDGPRTTESDVWSRSAKDGMEGPSQRWPVGITVHDRDPPSPTEGGQERLAEPDYVRPSVVDLTRAEMQPFDWRSTKEMLETITVHLTKEQARSAKELARWGEKVDGAATYRSVIEFYREESEAACARLKWSDAEPTRDEVIEYEMLALKLHWAAQAIEAGPVGEVHDKVAALAARSEGRYGEGQPVCSRSAASFADQAKRFDNLASRIDAAPSWKRVYDEMHDALAEARRKLPVLPETLLEQPFTPAILSRVLAELSNVTVPTLSTPGAGEEPMRAAQSRVVYRSALIPAGNKFSDWKVEYERHRRRHARRAYVKNPASLPGPVRTYLEGVWRWEADASIATMGAPPSGHVWTIDPLDDQTDILLELPSSDLVGWQWGDLYTLVISIPRNDLVAGRYDRLTADISNG